MSYRNDRLKRRIEGLSTPPIRIRHDSPAPNLASGDQVRIHTSAEAIEAGLAGMVGEVVAISKVVDAGAAVIGTTGEDGAVNVSFREKAGTFWFAKNQLDRVNQSTSAEIKNTGDEPEPLAAKPKPWWKFGF